MRNTGLSNSNLLGLAHLPTLAPLRPHFHLFFASVSTTFQQCSKFSFTSTKKPFVFSHCAKLALVYPHLSSFPTCLLRGYERPLYSSAQSKIPTYSVGSLCTRPSHNRAYVTRVPKIIFCGTRRHSLPLLPARSSVRYATTIRLYPIKTSIRTTITPIFVPEKLFHTPAPLPILKTSTDPHKAGAIK
jgi:hypothetical protein